VKKKLLIGALTAIILIIVGIIVFKNTITETEINKYTKLGNKEVLDELPQVPQATVLGGKYEQPQKIEFKDIGDGETVYYTLDDTKVTKDSNRYVQAITINKGTTILRVMAFNNKNEISSKEARYKYIITDSSDYIFQFSDRKVLTDSEMKNLDKKLLPYARNEIYARHGLVFKKSEFKNYFELKSWYESNASFKGTLEELNEFEKKNIELIQKYEGDNTSNSKKGETRIAYILDSYKKNNKNYVVIDFIEWLGADDWEKINEIEGFQGDKEACIGMFLPNDYYIYNEKKENIIMEVDKQAEIIKLPDGGVPEPYKGSFGSFSIYHPHKIIIREGTIIKIEQYYVP